MISDLDLQNLVFKEIFNDIGNRSWPELETNGLMNRAILILTALDCKIKIESGTSLEDSIWTVELRRITPEQGLPDKAAAWHKRLPRAIYIAALKFKGIEPWCLVCQKPFPINGHSSCNTCVEWAKESSAKW